MFLFYLWLLSAKQQVVTFRATFQLLLFSILLAFLATACTVHSQETNPTVAADEFTSERVVDCIIELAPGTNLRIGSLVLVSIR